jgi:hypothetical protein
MLQQNLQFLHSGYLVQVEMSYMTNGVLLIGERSPFLFCFVFFCLFVCFFFFSEILFFFCWDYAINHINFFRTILVMVVLFLWGVSLLLDF